MPGQHSVAPSWSGAYFPSALASFEPALQALQMVIDNVEQAMARSSSAVFLEFEHLAAQTPVGRMVHALGPRRDGRSDDPGPPTARIAFASSSCLSTSASPAPGWRSGPRRIGGRGNTGRQRKADRRGAPARVGTVKPGAEPAVVRNRPGHRMMCWASLGLSGRCRTNMAFDASRWAAITTSTMTPATLISSLQAPPADNRGRTAPRLTMEGCLPSRVCAFPRRPAALNLGGGGYRLVNQ